MQKGPVGVAGRVGPGPFLVLNTYENHSFNLTASLLEHFLGHLHALLFIIF